MHTWQAQFSTWLEHRSIPAGAAGVPLVVHSPAELPLAVLRALAAGRGAMLVIAPDGPTAESLLDALRIYARFSGDTRPLLPFPAGGSADRRQWAPEHDAARSAALDAASRGAAAVFVAPASALLAPTLPPRSFSRHTLELVTGSSDWPPEKLADALTDMDYDNEVEVHVPGEFARRGGLVDLFSPLAELPVRLEYFGNTIESMRFFHPDTQRSVRPVERLRVPPRGETVSGRTDTTSATFFDYLSTDTPCVVASPERIHDHLSRFESPEIIARWEQALTTRTQVVLIEFDSATLTTAAIEPVAAASANKREVIALDQAIGAHLAELGPGTENWRWQQLRGYLQQWHSQGHTVVAFAGSQGETDRLREILAEKPETRELPVCLEPTPIPAGVFIPDAGLVFLSEHELFGRRVTARSTRTVAYSMDQVLRDGSDLEEGGFAVHASHGVCRYHGVRELEFNGKLQEVLDLEFAEDARLYVPLEQIHLVSRYIGGSRKLPHLSRLGGAHWKNAKAAAATSALDLAAALLRLAAVRQHAPGFPFRDTGDWEHAFADAFPYRATADQARAISEVLDDMGKSQPMDRLLCGDVGYGKTEVAMRAAFRAVLNHKQVAVLVPTTILAQQHYMSFRERMAEYPVRIEMVSRFRTKAEQRQILAAAADGAVDILIGTHRLLQEDVTFRDLGLTIIDEEQRFGVEHKEKLKHLRASVDILTMTATPIPRTLYFSLSGIRNLSTIMTPPVDRLPVTTVISHFDETLIRQAILRELERKGQVFFLHNRVQTIDAFCDRLRKLVPEARFTVGHGQMSAEELEDEMSRFLTGEVDVLVCTTIIESGLDIPNANTIFIDRADRFGLAELYQLRGRVGRYHHQAYAYLLLPPQGIMPRDARERIAAIRRYTHMGAGFKLALRDLEIRGAGNILGGEQSGHIAAVGFELYCNLLHEAVRRLGKQETGKPEPLPDVNLNLDMVAFALHDRGGRLAAALPPDYVGAEATRLECYRRLNACTTPADVAGFADELADRFGPPPEEVEALLEVSRIRLLARQKRVHAVTVREGRLLLETERGLRRLPGQGVPRLQAAEPLAQLREIRRLLEGRPG